MAVIILDVLLSHYLSKSGTIQRMLVKPRPVPKVEPLYIRTWKLAKRFMRLDH